MDSRILSRTGKVAAVAVAEGELMASNPTWDIDVDDIDLGSRTALLKVKDGASGNIKVTMGDGTIITLVAADVNESIVHVKKVFKTDTTLSNDFFLWV